MVGYAQSDIHFTILKSETKGLSEDVVNALDLKLHQVFNRNSAAAADVYNVFAVLPSLSLDKVLSTDGGMVRTSLWLKANWCLSPRTSSTVQSIIV